MAIGEIFLSAFLQVLFEKLANLAFAGISLYSKKTKQRQHKSIERWQKNLKLIEAVLSDAEQKQLHSNAVKVWLQDLQDLAFDLEDVLDEFVTEARIHELGDDALQEHDSRSGCLPFSKVQVPSFLTSSSKPKSANNPDIEQISSRLQDILTQSKTLGLSSQTQSREEQRGQRSTDSSSLVHKSQVYGRGDEKDEIIRRLLEDDPCWENYVVVPVVGKGGIGKTTLAQCVYDDEQVKNHFNYKAWVCVSDVFDVKQITTTICSASPATHDISDLNMAHEKLKKLLADKRFLIVLDDVWSDEYDPWDKLQTPFLTAAKGSRVLVTTRSERVAKNMLKRPTQSPIIYLKGLSDNDCWLLFQQHALEDDNLIEIRDEVVKLVKGLPLAAKALGGLLRVEDKSRWSKILKSKIWSEETGVLPSLRLSYHHLPQHLKRIFAYCSIFPKDHRYVEKDVVLMWMAEGFLQEDAEESMEDKGHSYFLDLVSRSLMEPSPYYKENFIMHDLIHDLAQWAVGDVVSKMDVKSISSRTRYFSCTKEVIKEVMEDQPWTQEKMGQLRTFAYFGSRFDIPTIQMPDSNFQRFHYLRLLSMAGMGITELPNCIGDLKLLRFLDLSFNAELMELPESTSKLCNLQTLLLRGCRSLRKLVTNMAQLTDLRHLDIDEYSDLMETPLGIGRLTKLRTFNRFCLTPTSGFRIRELKNLKSLSGSLDIFGLENVVRSKDAQEAKLDEKSSLEVLRLFWGTSTYEVDQNIERNVLDQLQPQKSITELQLKGYKALVFPAWLGNPSFTQMAVIRLEDCKICDCLPPLGSLPSLKELWVKRMDGLKTVGPEFYGISCSNPFPALKTLHFEDMESWEEWSHPSVDNSKEFPHLEKLEILRCPLLRGNFPSCLPSLKTLKVDQCHKLRISLPSFPSLQELEIDGCEELSSSGNVVCCSNIIMLTNVSQFTEIQGFWVPGVEYLRITVSNPTCEILGRLDKCLSLVNCQTLSHYVYGDLDKLIAVELENCKEVAMFLEHSCPSSVRHLIIYDDNSLKQLSRLTNRITCLQQLHIGRCSSLSTIGGLPVTLVKLVIKDVNIEQPTEEWGLHLLTSLRDLELVNMGSAIDSVESVPGLNFLLPSSLQSLIIHGFPNLKSLSCSSLPNIHSIEINNCPLLSQGCIQVPDGLTVNSDPHHQYVIQGNSYTTDGILRWKNILRLHGSASFYPRREQ